MGKQGLRSAVSIAKTPRRLSSSTTDRKRRDGWKTGQEGNWRWSRQETKKRSLEGIVSLASHAAITRRIGLEAGSGCALVGQAGDKMATG
jgi:hypothetical protein